MYFGSLDRATPGSSAPVTLCYKRKIRRSAFPVQVHYDTLVDLLHNGTLKTDTEYRRSEGRRSYNKYSVCKDTNIMYIHVHSRRGKAEKPLAGMKYSLRSYNLNERRLR